MTASHREIIALLSILSKEPTILIVGPSREPTGVDSKYTNLIGTSGSTDYLNDPIGDRRFWPPEDSEGCAGCDGLHDERRERLHPIPVLKMLPPPIPSPGRSLRSTRRVRRNPSRRTRQNGVEMSFMMQIEATQRSPLDQLAVDYFARKTAHPSIDFCRRAAGVPEDDEKVARRLSVAVSMVRGWRELGRRASRWGCQ